MTFNGQDYILNKQLKCFEYGTKNNGYIDLVIVTNL